MIWLIGLGGSLGAATRFLLGRFITNKTQRVYPFPIGTWLINCTGSFLLGVLTSLHQTYQISDLVFAFFGVGFCGAYTTFSTFGHETITLIQANHIKLAVIYVITSVIIGTLSAWAGLVILN
ncbi:MULTISPECIES: fluoride efflux transporter CrcB [Bacillaceae]|uniref:Fluoride-specific ion channel FluC n=1 Tax=Peribacillus huizhouensis TaxID=1501239 RepID=A0ABR6CQG7_9BACI|nr:MULTISPECIES: fluoride efflux transporter CrcB [Bacillaceae]MBA9027284.1 CrcB protein [Peribacillus huizhouensis]